MGCSSSKELVSSESVDIHEPARAQQPRLPASPYMQQRIQQNPRQPSRPPQPQYGQGLQRTEVQNIPPPPRFSSSSSSALRSFSAPEIWPRLVKLGNLPVTVVIHSHLFSNPPGETPCWTYISQGLSEVAQPEVVFTMARRPNENVEAFPTCPLDWITTIYGLAKEDVHVETGMIIDIIFDRGGVFLKHNQAMIAQDPKNWQVMNRFGSLVHGMPLSNSCYKFQPGTLPPNSHHVIALTHEETAVAKQFGVTRVLGHLGLSVRWFPFPPWIDRDRADTVTMADQGGSIRIQTPIARVYGLNVMLIKDDIILTIPAEEDKRKAFRDYVMEGALTAAVGLDSFMAEEADSGLIWKKGQKAPVGYSKYSGSMEILNLAFLIIAPEQAKDDSIMVEDGYGIFLRNSTWQTVRDAIQNTQDIAVPLLQGKRFILNWRRATFHNPMDGREYTASWRTYHQHSARPKPKSNSHVDMSQVVFLCEPPSGSIDDREFVDYIKRIVNVLEQQTPEQPPPTPRGSTHPGRQAIVELELPKRAGWLKMVVSPSNDGIDTQGIMTKIGGLQEPEARAILKLQLYFNLWGYQGPKASFS